MVKNPSANAGDIRNMGLIPGLGRRLEKGMATHSSKNGQRSLAGYSPWGCKESDMTEATWHAHTTPTRKYLLTWRLQCQKNTLLLLGEENG